MIINLPKKKEELTLKKLIISFHRFESKLHKYLSPLDKAHVLALFNTLIISNSHNS